MFICIIHSIDKRNTTNYIIKKAISIIRREENVNMDVKIIVFFSKDLLIFKWIFLFVSENILRFTEKFILNEDPFHDLLEIIKLYLIIKKIN